ncbi:MAG: ABC transporter ATP-binding protein [Gemmatimonadales bacterium]|nr:ABC transporter ATP-binding protein [Gemmatimonadales bacterium]
MAPPGPVLGAVAPVIEARGLVRRYGRTLALAGVDLLLGAHEVLVVVGPNGAGKSTLLRVLAGLARPSAGTVLVLGRPIGDDDPEVRRAIGLVSHRSLLYDDLTLHENLAFAGRLYGLPAPAEAATAALAEVGLEAKAGESPRNLSRGMLQRATIARALQHQPALLLLDEPFTGLDAEWQERIRQLLAARIAAGAAAVAVTHQPAELWQIATRVAAFSGGRWALDEARVGEPDAFLARFREAVPA